MCPTIVFCRPQGRRNGDPNIKCCGDTCKPILCSDVQVAAQSQASRAGSSSSRVMNSCPVIDCTGDVKKGKKFCGIHHRVYEGIYRRVYPGGIKKIVKKKIVKKKKSKRRRSGTGKSSASEASAGIRRLFGVLFQNLDMHHIYVCFLFAGVKGTVICTKIIADHAPECNQTHLFVFLRGN